MDKDPCCRSARRNLVFKTPSSPAAADTEGELQPICTAADFRDNFLYFLPISPARQARPLLASSSAQAERGCGCEHTLCHPCPLAALNQTAPNHANAGVMPREDPARRAGAPEHHCPAPRPPHDKAPQKGPSPTELSSPHHAPPAHRPHAPV